jgi:hypothetical protein
MYMYYALGLDYGISTFRGKHKIADCRQQIAGGRQQIAGGS